MEQVPKPDAVRLPRVFGLVPRVRGFDRLLLLPLLVPAVLLAAGNDAFGFDPPGWIDPYVYLGYFWHYPEHLWVFDDNSNYKISRLPWILPGFLVHAALPPVAAARVLAYCTLASAATALYLYLRDAIRDRYIAAFLSIVLACCTWIHADGWYYHAVAAAGLYLWSCWMATRAASGPNPVIWAAAAGACYAAAAHTHLFLVVFAPLVMLVYWAALDPQERAPARAMWLTAAASAVAGGVALTVVLATINRATGGSWLFFIPQIEQALKVSGDKYWSPVGNWLPTATYLVLPVAMTIMGLAGYASWRVEPRRAGTLVALPWLALGIMSILQLVVRQTTLDHSYMAFPVYLHAFGGAAIALSRPRADASRWRPLLLAGAVGLVLGLLLLNPAHLAADLNLIARRLGLAQAPAIAAPLLFCVVGIVITRVMPSTIRIIVAAGWMSLVNVWVAPQPAAYGIGTPGVRQEMLETFREADAFTHRLDPTLIGIKYWLSSEELQTAQGPLQSQAVFDSFLATRAWLANLFARTSPGLPVESLTLDHLAAASCVGILSSPHNQTALAQAMMAHYAALGSPLRILAERRFERGDFSFALTIMKRLESHAVVADDPQPCAPRQTSAP
jgi:hypothetical protein